jgi:hypothetical protein
MTSKITSRAACLAELASNPKSFLNCPDLHGGVPDLPGDIRPKGKACIARLGFGRIRHVNNPIPKVSGNRISRFRQDARFESFANRDPRLLSKKFFSLSCIAEPAFAQSGYAHPGGWRVSLTSLQPSTPYSNRRRTLSPWSR